MNFESGMHSHHVYSFLGWFPSEISADFTNFSVPSFAVAGAPLPVGIHPTGSRRRTEPGRQAAPGRPGASVGLVVGDPRVFLGPNAVDTQPPKGRTWPKGHFCESLLE